MPMQLSPEDSLRLNVLLANKPLAIRINESRMTVEGLMDDSETCITLNPNQKDDHYLKVVRALLSEHALGNPGGYPSFLQRWSRMGQMREKSLEPLLLLGEHTAIYAVVTSEGITDEIARRAWWARDEADNARFMLQVDAIVKGQTGKLLAEYLVEYLPFETETDVMMSSIRMVLQPGLLDNRQKQALWKKSSRKTAYLAGFLAGSPHDLPLAIDPHSEYNTQRSSLDTLVEAGNLLAETLRLALSSKGQAFWDTAIRILEKPPTQDVVTSTLDFIHHYLSHLRDGGQPDCLLPELQAEAKQFIALDAEAKHILSMMPNMEKQLMALVILSGLNYGVVRPILGDSTAVGSLMRRKLTPILEPIRVQMHLLLGR